MGWGKPMGKAWKRTREWVMARDGHRCQECGAEATTVDHIVPRHRGGTDKASNLRALCQADHGKKTAAEGHRARGQGQSRYRPPEKHPGLIERDEE